ncbi:MAG TPA: ATP-binding protein [Gammaproteobacteria bacterium]
MTVRVTAAGVQPHAQERRTDYGQRIHIEQLHTLHRYLPPILGVNLLVGGAMLYGLLRIAPQPALIIWGMALVAMVLIRLALYAHYRRTVTRYAPERHSRYFVFGSALSGLLWGVAGVLFFQPGALDYQLFILFILVGMGAGAVSSLTAYMPAFYAYFPVSMLPISAELFGAGDSIHLALGIMTLAYVGALSFFGHNINRSLVQSLQLRFENMDLVRELSAQKEQAVQANIAKSRFLAAASHDLRQPLHALTLYTSLLDEVNLNPDAHQVIGRINASIHTLRNLFNALLDISKLEAGTLIPVREDFALQPLLDRLANDFAVDAEQQGLILDIAPSTAILHSDPALLEQILRNYLSNALRYTERGHIRVLCSQADGQLRIEVSDTGIGIAPDQQDAIFGEFYQVGNPERDRSKGLGLGLAIVERISHLLGHSIDVQSAPGAGATFSVSVPLGMPKPRAPDTSPRQGTVPALDRQMLLVVIDDDQSVLDSTQALFERWGCAVVTGTALESVRAQLIATGNRPDGIIADHRLPGGHTGIEAIRDLQREYGEDLPCLIITGDTAAKPLRDLQDSGVQLLHKPVAPAKLRAFLNHAQRMAARRAQT